MFNKQSIMTFGIFLIPLGILCSTAVVFFQNTLYIAFNFIIILAITSIFIFCLRAEFLAYTVLIVYIGAVAILFLFIIMMLNLKINLFPLTALSTWEVSIVFLLIIKSLIVYKVMLIPNIISSLGKGLIWSNFWHQSNNYNISHFDNIISGMHSSNFQIEILGQLLYVDFFYLFIMVGIILLVAMVGALVLTTSKNLIKT